MTSTEQFEKVATTARTATEKSVEMWKQGAQTFADQANKLTGLPQVDVTSGVQKYFEMVQRTVDVNRELAEKWAALVTSITGVAREQAKSVSSIVVEQAEKVGDLATAQAKNAEQLAHEEAETVEAAEKEAIRAAKAEERRITKEAHDKTREPYEGKTKAELSDLLAERDLPRTGNLDELVERLVEADTAK
jgi:hypothetical protein